MWTRFLCAAALAAVASSATVLAQAPAPSSPAGDGWVVLTVADYLALRERANPRAAVPVTPPARATLTEITYDLTAGDGLATGTADLTIDVLDDGWVEVPLPAALFVRAARLGGRPLPLADLSRTRGTQDAATGGRRILLSRKGRSLVSLDIAVPVVTRAGVESLGLPPAPGLVKAVLTVPRADVDLAASGGAIVERGAASAAVRVTAHAALGEALGFTWHRKRDVAETALPLRLRGRVEHVIGLGEETGILTARVTADVVQGAATAIALRVPDGLVVNQVQGAHVADWDVQSGVLTVTLLERVDRQTAFIVSGEFRPPPSGRMELPMLRLVDAEREAGAVAVEVLGAGEVTTHEARGLDPADASELGDLLAGRTSPAIVAFRYRGDQPGAPRALGLTLTRYAPQEVLLAAVDEARYRAMVSEDGKALVEARLAVRNNQRSFLALTLPASATLWSAAVDGRPVRPGTGPKGSLLIPLQKKRLGTDAARIIVSLMYVDRTPAWGPSGDWRLTLPAIDLPVQQSGLTIHASPRYRLTPMPGDFHVEAYEPPLSEALRLSDDKEIVNAPGAREADLRLKDEVASADGPPPQVADQVGQEGRTRGLAGEGRGDLAGAKPSLGGLVERFRREAGGVRSVGTLPVLVAFPESGAGVYLAAQLTAEGAAPAAAFTFKRAVK